MNQVVARSAVQHANLKEMATVVEDMDVKNVKCSRLFAQLAAKTPWFLSSPVVTDLYIAKTASNRSPATTTGKID